MAEMTCITTGCRNPVHKIGNRFCADHAIAFLTRQLKQISSKRSLRDDFAAQALTAIGTWTPAHGGTDLGSKAAMQARALWAYEQADAMLVERAKADDDA